MSTKKDYSHWDGKRLYRHVLLHRTDGKIEISELMTIEASGCNVVASEGDGKNARVTVFDRWLVDSFKPNTDKQVFTVQNKTEVPDYLCFQTVDLRKGI